jgi:hypothetical protein
MGLPADAITEAYGDRSTARGQFSPSTGQSSATDSENWLTFKAERAEHIAGMGA